MAFAYNQNRLGKKKDFDEIFGSGWYLNSQTLTLRFRKTENSFSRFSVIVSTKVSKRAVDRNRLRRQVREILRKSWDRVPLGFDFMVIIKPGKKIATSDALAKELWPMVDRMINFKKYSAPVSKK
ncbi:MAG: ribonuclease P protein component [Parcubacteria group bacterium Gr01-1014_18]|nr:MAG: ribonuclease P protein component [Parcubacteria group bacterium Greene0416_36]TSC81156.1 MAG: ribonuclease P protein component [Parcubacteria group bacterium Gr01-1014_18]TSC99153.1 MAG: ribonuclease P protein component [Parcubacteria group bacterium Greene1014_20]TSD07489.1 MAG: ribonuclease P protein component [Parcubacteria group bacterium Greene0714_2]